MVDTFTIFLMNEFFKLIGYCYGMPNLLLQLIVYSKYFHCMYGNPVVTIMYFYCIET